MKHDHDRVEELVSRALEFKPEERAAFLSGACGGDADLRGQVESLLAAGDGAPGFLADTPTLLETPLAEGPGSRIGRYKLLQEIGEGGMGVVYMAEQEEPVRRRVALKIIKLGMDTRSVVARFEAERQALAMMDHPNIAHVLDGGSTETGRPYFVMELVQGVPITQFCDQAKLPAVERLKLFIQVCQAVQSAHQKGVIHRDLKPSNILVTLHHGEPMPKVIDFGIAKATNQKLTEKTLFTQHATMIGTPAYMSPEQAELTSMDVDTRTDVYALGVLLYELLTGTTPFPEKRLRSLGYGEMQRVIADEEPERPSTRLSTLAGEQKTAVSKNSGEELAALSQRLRGDLDWVVMKCLEKDRRRRYETANGLAADIQRHLNNEPVVARPPSAAYRFQKAWRRNKVVFAAGAAVVLALVVGVIGTTAGLIRAEGQRRAAQREETRLRELTNQALEGEKAQLARAEAASENLQAVAYANAINLAQKAVADQNLGLAWNLLNQQRPAPGRPDRRGWEWRYLWQQCQSDAMSSPLVPPQRYHNLRVSPDGKLLVAMGSGSALLEIPESHQLRAIDPVVGADKFHLVAFSQDSGLLAIAMRLSAPGADNDHGLLRLLDTRTWKTVAETYTTETLEGLFFSPEGTTLLGVQPYADETAQLALWQVPTLERITNSPMFRIPSGGLWDRAKSPKRGVEITASADLSAIGVLIRGRKVRVVDMTTGRERWHVDGTAFIGLQFSPDGKHLLISSGLGGGEPSVRIFDAHSGQELGPGLTEHREWISSMVFWPDGKTLATASTDQTIRLWDLSDPTRPKSIGRPLQGHKAEVWALALLPDQRTLVSSDKEGTFLTWDTQRARTDRTRLTLTGTNGWGLFRFGLDGKTIFAVDREGAVVRFSGADFEVRDEVANLGKDSFGAALSRDCHFLACGSTNGLVQLWDLSRRTRVKQFSVGSGLVMPFAFRGDGKSLIVHHQSDQTLSEWDLATFKEMASWQDLFRGSLCLSPDERWFFTFDENGGNNVFLSRDMVTGLWTVQTNLPSKVENLVHLASSPDGRLLVASSEKGYARILDRSTLRPVATLSGFLVQAVFSSRFSPDGTRLATASGGREALRLWSVEDVERSQPLVALAASQHSLFTDVQFSPDGNTLGALAADPASIHLWRAPSWAEIEKAEAAAGKPQGP